MTQTAFLPRRSLGKTGLEVTALCIGTGPLGNMPKMFTYSVAEERALATIRAIFTSPINFIDTAAIYGDGESDKGAFLDQFFKTGKLEGSKLSFTTEIVHGVAFDFKGSIERGEGKSRGDDAYYVLKGTLTENTSDANKKVTSRSREVVFKMFPQEAGPAAPARY